MSKIQNHNESINATTIDSRAQAAVTAESAPILLARVLAEELKEIKGVATFDEALAKEEFGVPLEDVFKELHRQDLTALCFSGGGIRSATFGLGIVQALAKHGLLSKFDYLSTVSGGGYMGAWLSAWVLREGYKHESTSSFEAALRGEELNEIEPAVEGESTSESELSPIHGDSSGKLPSDIGITNVQKNINCIDITDSKNPSAEPKQLRHLREYSNYMSPKVGLLSADTWTFIGIYLRNLLLNWTIFVPLIAAVLLIPRFFLAITDFRGGDIKIPGTEEWVVYVILALGLLAGAGAVCFVVRKLPSKNNDKLDAGQKIMRNTDGWVLTFGTLPLLLLAIGTTTVWAWWQLGAIVNVDSFNRFRPYFAYESANIIFFTVAIFLLGYTAFYITKRPRVKIDVGGIFIAAVSSLIGGLLIWLVAHNFFGAAFFSEVAAYPNHLLIYVCVAVPIFLLMFLIEATVFVGLSSMFVTDDDREWLARFGAWILIVSGAWLILSALVLFGPLVFQVLIDSIKTLALRDWKGWKDFVSSSILPLIAAISGFVSLVGGFSSKSLVKDEPAPSKLSRVLAIAPKIAAVVFLVFIFAGVAWVTSSILPPVGNFINEVFDKRVAWMAITETANHREVLEQATIGQLFIWLLSLSAVGIVMAFFINVNKFSLHGAYRDRLIRAYLGASNPTRKGNEFTGFDDTDNFQLHRLKGQKPFHVINATLNLISGKNLAWQNRKAATFTMSPLHCGSWLLGYRNTNEYCRNPNLANCKKLRFCNKRDKSCKSVNGADCELPGKAIRLGTAMAISGAAANPNMGYYSSSVVTFLMSLFNIRLGWWLGNTGKVGGTTDRWGVPYFSKPSPSIAVLPLINETLGRTDEEKRYLNVTDGGHFENLGIYEMVLRRCRVIIVSDAAADAEFKFSEISNAIQKCKVDLGVDIKFHDGINIFARNSAGKEGVKKARFAMAEITYPNGPKAKGYLLYTRPAYYGDESAEIRHYARANRSFPHQSTGDQMYDEAQFESYRSLGFLTIEKIIGKNKHADLYQLMEALRRDSNNP